jgi:hypothetical protein
MDVPQRSAQVRNDIVPFWNYGNKDFFGGEG